jgi:hypothetical protein
VTFFLPYPKFKQLKIHTAADAAVCLGTLNSDRKFSNVICELICEISPCGELPACWLTGLPHFGTATPVILNTLDVKIGAKVLYLSNSCVSCKKNLLQRANENIILFRGKFGIMGNIL